MLNKKTWTDTTSHLGGTNNDAHTTANGPHPEHTHEIKEVAYAHKRKFGCGGKRGRSKKEHSHQKCSGD